MSLEVIILRGLPASGKTTWAREFLRAHPTFVRVNRDDLRSMMHDVWNETNEMLTVQARNTIIVTALIHGRSVIVDDTNLVAYTIDAIQKIIAGLPHDIEVRQVWMETSIDECIRRDRERPETQRVGEARIREMYESMSKENFI